jgi:hypothetical protein
MNQRRAQLRYSKLTRLETSQNQDTPKKNQATRTARQTKIQPCHNCQERIPSFVTDCGHRICGECIPPMIQTCVKGATCPVCNFPELIDIAVLGRFVDSLNETS